MRNILTLILVAGAPLVAVAQPVSDASAVKVERVDGGKKLYRITTAVVLKVAVPHPGVTYVLDRTATEYVPESMTEGFLHKVVDAAAHQPFEGDVTR